MNAIKILQQENNLQGRIIKTTNVACEFIITSDREFFENIGEEETKRYFQTAYDFVSSYKGLGKKYILSAKVHLDESTPHMHLVFIPVIHKIDKKSGKPIDKIACSEYWKGKDSYRELQNNFHKYVIEHGFNLERGKANNTQHLKIETLKQITNYENIKYELSQEEIQPINSKNIKLVLKQNQELIKYTNKLKTQLNKSYNAINRVTKLQQDNTNLKIENEELKKENNKLKIYIERTFQVVKNLFSFPIDRFKRLVDNFTNYFQK